MDWLRRNWPDLLIGLALIAVIAGIVATLLTGGSFFPFGDEAPIADPATTTPSVSAPATPDASTTPSTTPSTAPNTVDGPAVAVLPPSGAANQDATTPPGAPDPAVTSEGDPVTDPAASQSDGSNSATPATAASESNAAESAPVTTAPATVAPATTAPATTAPATTAPAAAAATTTPVSGESGLPTEPYRVSVGAFGVRGNAETQAQRFRAAGYPVFLAQQDDLNLVLVGPYLQEADARRVAAEIAAGDYGIEPVVYHYQPDASGAAGATPDASSASTASPSTASPSTVTPSSSAAPSVAAEGTRLQVGAYADRESASALIETLQSLGFDVATLDEGGLVKLVVGPFSGDALRDARIILDGAGIDSFARQ